MYKEQVKSEEIKNTGERRRFLKNFSSIVVSCFLSSVLSAAVTKESSAGVCCYSNCYSVCYSDRGRR